MHHVQSRSSKLTSRRSTFFSSSIADSTPCVAARPATRPAIPLPTEPIARGATALLPPFISLMYSSSVLTSSSVRSARARLLLVLLVLSLLPNSLERIAPIPRPPTADPMPDATPSPMTLPIVFSAAWAASSTTAAGMLTRLLFWPATAFTPSTATPLAAPPITAFLMTLSSDSSPAPTSFPRRVARPPRASRSRDAGVEELSSPSPKSPRRPETAAPLRSPFPKLLTRDPRAPAGRERRASRSRVSATGSGADNAGDATATRTRETMADLANMMKVVVEFKKGLSERVVG
ncbi:hypothetical protein B0H17DRAFT_1069926 [Mycena rosella]|uniref:Uncharacterized protein n=1 Tax=Mycena rosella TaxID=1033263 RepID=A0AAD7DAY2_MYCRO|nr:hypothetical protein B0H17DRAFT_1069926 [Mycena rosella]